MTKLSEQLELLSPGAIEVALIYDGLTKLRRDAVKLVAFSMCEDMRNPYSTFERDLQRDLDRLKRNRGRGSGKA